MVPYECQIKATETDGKPSLKVDFFQESGALSLLPAKLPLPHWAINYLNVRKNDIT
jgi:hypothetical protein